MSRPTLYKLKWLERSGKMLKFTYTRKLLAWLKSETGRKYIEWSLLGLILVGVLAWLSLALFVSVRYGTPG